MSHRPHGAGDIVPGSRWPSARGPGHAIVRDAAAGWIEFTYSDGTRVLELERMHHTEFRKRFVAPYDSRALRSQFSMCLANLQSFHAFFGRRARRIFARSVSRPPEESRAAARGSPAVPPDAVFVGTYYNPFAPDRFLDDLNDALATDGHDSAAA